MPMYTFHLRRQDDAPVGFAAIELAHDAATFAKAGDLLDQHLSCDHVDVWDGDRAVVARHREKPIIRPIAEAEGWPHLAELVPRRPSDVCSFPQSEVPLP